MARQLEKEIISEMLEWPNEKICSTFGGWRLERIVNEEKAKLQLKLKTIWRLRKWYTFRDTDEQFGDEAMLLYFNPRKVKSYTLSDIEYILDRLDRDTVYSNPGTE